MKLKHLITSLVVMLLLSIGCGARMPQSFHYTHSNIDHARTPVRVIPIWVDGTFGEADKLAIDDSVNQWNYALNGYVRLEVRSTTFNMSTGDILDALKYDGWLILKVNSTHPKVLLLDGPQPAIHRTLAWADSIGGYRIFVIRDRIPNEWMAGVMLHEMGHLLGAPHDSVYLMQPTFNWAEYRCVDYQALKLVAEYQHLNVEDLNYCVYGDAANLPVSCKIGPEYR